MFAEHAAREAGNKEANPNYLACSEAGCLMASNLPRRANKDCGQSPPRCSQCCKRLGGCNVKGHKLTSRDIPTQPESELVATAVPSQAHGASPGLFQVQAQAVTSAAPPSRGYARPLKLEYGAFVDQQQERHEASQKLEEDRALAARIYNTVKVVVWAKVFN